MTSTTIHPKLTHAGINVYDIEKMRRFYVEVMGLVESDRGYAPRLKAEIVFLSVDPTKHHQFVLVTGRAPEAKVSTINQLSFMVGSLGELRQMHRRVKDYGVAALTPVNHGNAWSIYFEDPEGNTVEVYCDTPWYVAQPHGDLLDLALSDDEIFRRTEEICRKDPHFLPVREWQDTMRRRIGEDV